MKSQNITNYVDKCLTAENICAIIKECSVSGVSELSYKDLHVTFAGPRSNDKDIHTHLPGPAWNTLDDKKDLAQVEINLMDDRLSELQLLDPLKYEEMMANKEFNN
jgi:hypothetical protein